MYTCVKCLVSKPVDDFYKRKSRLGHDKTCKDCRKKYNKENRAKYTAIQKKFRENNREYIRQYDKEYYRQHREAKINRAKLWYRHNKCRAIDSDRLRFAANPQYFKDKLKRFHNKYPWYNAAQSAKYRAIQAQATPSWLTKEQKAEINEFYILAHELTQKTGIKHEVDHIHPLQGTNFTGLHVPWNLQVITKSQNCLKSNKHPDDLL